MNRASTPTRLVRLAVCALIESFAISLTPPSALAQSQTTAGDLKGVVVDVSGAAIVGASVTIVGDLTGYKRSVTTGSDGRFIIAAVPIGRYRLEARSSGFEPLELQDTNVSLGAPTVVELVLRIAGVTYDLVVTPGRPLDDAQQPGEGLVIDRAEFDRLPISARNFIAFSLLTPTVAPDRTPQQGASRTSGLTFAGQDARSNNIVVDGMDNNDETVGSVRAVFSQEAVQQFQVLSMGYSAEFGKAAGGVVNIVTRSGTNAFRGSAFLYARDDSLNAKNYFEKFSPSGEPIAQPKAPYQQQQFGGVLGGPIKRDSLFVFGSVERLSANASNFVTIDDSTPVPNPVAGAPPLGTAAEILNRAGFPVTTGHVPFRVRSTQWLLKLDYDINSSQRLSVRVNGASELNENIEPFGGLVARSRAAALSNSDLMVSVSHTLVASQNTVNEGRLLFARRNQDVLSLDPTCDGPCDREDEGGPTLEVAGVASVGRQRFTPTPRDNVRFQFVDTISHVRGSHLFKAGVDASIIDGRRQALPLHFGGRYIFTALPAIPGLLTSPISSIQAVALGLPAAYVQGYGKSGSAYNVRDLAGFAEDLWRIRPQVSLRFGIRYQRQFWPPYEYETPGVAGSYTFPSDANNLAPRVAVSWSRASGRQVIRAGYGIYYEQTITAVAGITETITGRPDGVRTLVLPAPGAFVAWRAPGHRLPESVATALAGGSFPSVTIPIDPNLRTGYAQHAFAGMEQRVGRVGTFAATYAQARGYNALGTIDYNPVVPALGPGRRPNDVNGIPGTSASVLQYTSYGDSWYRALTLSFGGETGRRFQYRLAYTLSNADDTVTDFQSAFLPQDNGRGRDAADPGGLPVGFNPRDERGPALHDQRHRFSGSAWLELPGKVNLSGVVVAASGWPYNVLAGVDLNGDRDGGSFPSDRARRVPSDPATSLSRNSERLPRQAGVDVRLSRPTRIGRVEVEPLVEVFNLFNRANFTDVQNVFGANSYPSQPSSTFGQFTQAGPARQAQVAIRISF